MYLLVAIENNNLYIYIVGVGLMFKQFPLVYLHSMYRWREIGYTFVQAIRSGISRISEYPGDLHFDKSLSQTITFGEIF